MRAGQDGGDVSGGLLRDNVLDETVEQLCAVLDGELGVGGELLGQRSLTTGDLLSTWNRRAR